MLEIKLYLKRDWKQEQFSPREAFFSMDDTHSVEELFRLSSSTYGLYGRLIIEEYNHVYLDETCEIEFFFDTMCPSGIFSGEPYTVDNSYFQIGFHDRKYRHKLLISFKDETL